MWTAYVDERVKSMVGSGGCVVDLGCGSGHLLTNLADRFKERIGLDISRRRLDQATGSRRSDWEFREADLNSRFPLEDASSDVVVANQVIEHIVDPVRFCREIYRVLRPGGCCIITTPNIRYVKYIAHLILSGYGPRTAGGNTLDGAWDDGHVHYFTHRDLRELFLDVGFPYVHSRALISLGDGNWVRKLMDHYAHVWLVREFLSGCICLRAEK